MDAGEKIRVGLLSDTHGYLDERIMHHLSTCDEVWHAGDIGTIEVFDQLDKQFTFRVVYGNIDGAELRRACPGDLFFEVAGLKVYMTHIGGYPGRYRPGIQQKIRAYKPGLFICGHSHILKIMPDKRNGLIHMNPGAAGKHGFHKQRTLIRFSISEGKIADAEVVELGMRGAINDE